MKILIYSDNHYCQYSSLLRGRGEKYSIRLENQIESLNWVESLAKEKGCSSIVCGGDFFNSSSLNAEELTALKDISWAEAIEHVFLVGNHELGLNDLSYSSAHLFKLIPNAVVIDTPTMYNDNTLLLPYVLEADREDLSHYCGTKHPSLIISHNDLKGLQMGSFLSQTGFELNDIEEHCDLFINGHLHNGTKVSDKIINIGNLTGQNFSEDASVYNHKVMVVDTDTNSIEEYENPYAINFYKVSADEDITKLEFKNNAVLSVSTKISNIESVRSYIDSHKNILCSRVIIAADEHDTESVENKDSLTVDHLEKFKEFVSQTLGTSDTIAYELSEVLK